MDITIKPFLYQLSNKGYMAWEYNPFHNFRITDTKTAINNKVLIYNIYLLYKPVGANCIRMTLWDCWFYKFRLYPTSSVWHINVIGLIKLFQGMCILYIDKAI